MANERPCKLRIQIADGAIQEMENLGFYLMDSPDILIPPQRDYETEEYPETDGVNIYPYATYKEFDYTCKMLFLGSLESMNASIRSLWNSFFTSSPDSDIRTALDVTIYNDYKGISITGKAKEFSGSETTVQDVDGVWICELTIEVYDPKKCNWNL